MCMGVSLPATEVGPWIIEARVPVVPTKEVSNSMYISVQLLASIKQDYQ